MEERQESDLIGEDIPVWDAKKIAVERSVEMISDCTRCLVKIAVAVSASTSGSMHLMTRLLPTKYLSYVHSLAP